MDLGDRLRTLRFLIHDRDPVFTTAFGEVFKAEGLRIVTILPKTPRMNAIAERWISSARRECLDRMLITGEQHLRLVLGEYVDHYNSHRPHRALKQAPPGGRPDHLPDLKPNARILRRDRLGGPIREYDQVA